MPDDRSWAERLHAVESRNLTYRGEGFPRFWSRARGAEVEDAEGRRYLDLTSAFGPAFGGHRHRAVEEAVISQAGSLLHGMGDVHPALVKVELLERLAALAPWPNCRGVLATSGSEAVEVALKTALLSTGRAGLLSFEGGYHGVTLGALAVTSRALFRAPFEERIYQGVTFAPFPPDASAEAGADALTAARRALEAAEAGGRPIGGIIVEPIQGRGGVRIPPPGFLSGLAGLARDHGALFIVDEIFTGFGRTGRLFACEEDGVVPDLICAGKALGGGLPIGVCLGPTAVMDAWPASGGEAIHTSTFLGNPVSCAAASAVIRAMEEEDWIGRAGELGGALRRALEDRLADSPAVGDVRGRGLLVGVALVDEKGEPWRGGAASVAGAALEEGLIILPSGELGEVVELAPPVAVAPAELEGTVDRLARVIERTAGR